MSKGEAVLTGTHFMNGDTALAEGAIAAGCRFFAGYPITPATEVAERMAERLPELADGLYIQMEDELASMNALLGASWGGKKTMSATSGPGFSLMMENLGLGIMMEVPCVLANVQRGGPSTGLPTLVGQQDMMQARWGSHGDYEIIALSPDSPQECFDLCIHAFNLAEEYRTPVLIMTDEAVGHMFERVVIPEADKIIRKERPIAKKKNGEPVLPYKTTKKNLVPPMPEVGKGNNIHTTGLTHDERGYPVVTAAEQERLVKRLIDKIRLNADSIIQVEEDEVTDADVVLVAYGITSRVARMAKNLARQDGMKVGLLRPIVVWPFPEQRIRELAKRVKALIVPEINMGQVVLEVERLAAGACDVIPVPEAGGKVHATDAILAKVREVIA